MTDLEIARKCKLIPIQDIAKKLGIPEDKLELYGKYKAKLSLDLIDKKKIENGKLILVSAISPTPAGEGKTTVSIGLSEALNQLGKLTSVVLREPSLGPVFGIKGGATGGGYSQVLPMEDINLHFTGDFAAIEKAHNLLAALIDNALQNKPSLQLDSRTIVWKRVMDMNDRALRNIMVGLGGTTSGIPRESGFDITAASEIMAILCLSSGLQDLKRRLGNIFVGYTFDKKAVFARDLRAEGAMTALLIDAIKPNLVQTIEGNAAIIHGGPFANIAQGTNTVIATKMGLGLSEYAVTEAGFGFDLGGEKFFNIKCIGSGLKPKAVVLTATIRALKYHGGVELKDLQSPDIESLKKGLPNLEKHLESISKFGVEPIIAINQFASDDEAEIEVLMNFAKSKGVKISLANVWGKGGEGALDLAKQLIDVVEEDKSDLRALYSLESSIREKIRCIATEIYGAEGVKYSSLATKRLKTIRDLGLENLPICMAKTPNSLSDNPKLKARPTKFEVTVRDIEIAAGAGFIIPILGNIMRMPGLPAKPAAENIDVDENGNIKGLF